MAWIVHHLGGIAGGVLAGIAELLIEKRLRVPGLLISLAVWFVILGVLLAMWMFVQSQGGRVQ